MSAWNDGYITDIHYTYGYYKELSPSYLKFILLLKGYDVFNNLEQNHCELGFGQGITLNIHAATHNAHFVGTDFNPSHAAFAQFISKTCKNSTQIFDDSFEQLLQRDLPQFDSISLHGIWSWISTANQNYILKFIHKFLKPGGVVYISYNTLPGWMPLLPVRELLHHNFNHATSGENIIERTKQAIDLTLITLENSPAFNNISPKSIEQLTKLKEMDPHYIAHEYLNNEWHCVSFSDLQNQLKAHKLDFVGKTDFYSYTDFLHYTPQQLEYLKTIHSPILKEQTSDFLINNRFRKDLYVRGGIKLSPAQITEKMDQLRFVMTIEKHAHTNKVVGTAGEFNLKEDIYDPLINYLASNHYEPKRFKDIRTKFENITIFLLVQAICILCTKGEIAPCQDEQQISYQKAQAFNEFILQSSKLEHKLFILASPLTGQGIHVSYTTLLFLNALWKENLKQPKQWVEYAVEIMTNLNLTLYDKEKNALSTKELMSVELLRLANEFKASELSQMLEVHQVIDISKSA